MEQPARIEPDTGAVVSRRGVLDRRHTRTDFESGKWAGAATLSVDSPPWCTYELDLDDRLLASVVFEGQKLVEIRLLMTGPGEPDAPWTAEAEKRRRLEHDAWLQAQLGSTPSRFPWGTVESVYDERANCSHIILRYS
jgi:hypothetical protein